MSCCCGGDSVVLDGKIEEKGTYVEKVRKGLKDFDKNTVEMVTTYQTLMTLFENVAQNFNEFSQGDGASSQSSVRAFSEAMKKMKNGEAMMTFQTAVKRQVRETLPPLTAHCDKTYNLFCSLKKLKKTYNSSRREMSKTEEKYAKMNKTLDESKSYAKSRKKRDEASVKYEEREKEFCGAVDRLKEMLRDFVGTALPGFAACNSSFAKFLCAELGRHATGAANGWFAPNTADGGDAQAQEEGSNARNASPDGGNPLTLEEKYYQMAAGKD